MTKRYESEIGKVVLYKYKDQWQVYGNSNQLEFSVKVSCPIEAEHIFNYWRERIYTITPIVKDRVKLGMSPSAMVSEL
jgi:hypothetical protein